MPLRSRRSAYTGSYGAQTSVLQMHAGNGDMGDLGERFLACFVAAADDAGLPGDPAFRNALRAYMRWAVDDVLARSAVGFRVTRAGRCRAGHETDCSPM